MTIQATNTSPPSKILQNRQIPSPLVRKFISQLLQAIDFANCCGVIHTDIQAGNILIQIPDESFIDRCVHDIDTVTKEVDDSAGYTIIKTQGLRDFYFGEGFNMMTLDIALSDWGVASWTNKHLTEIIQPVLLRAPEVILEAPWGRAVDIWNIGAMIPEFIYAQTMFSRHNKTNVYRAAVHLEEMIKLIGPIPRSLVGKATVHGDLFGGDGYVSSPELEKFMGLEERFAGMGSGESARFVALVKSTLELDPEKRKTAKELSDEPWLRHEYREDGYIRRLVRKFNRYRLL